MELEFSGPIIQKYSNKNVDRGSTVVKTLRYKS